MALVYQMLDHELQTPFALVLVHIESIDESRALRHRRSGVASLEMIEGDRVEPSPRAFELDPHLEVLLAHHARAFDAKALIERRFGECLPPRPAAANRLGDRQGDLLDREFTIGLDAIGERRLFASLPAMPTTEGRRAVAARAAMAIGAHAPPGLPEGALAERVFAGVVQMP